MSTRALIGKLTGLNGIYPMGEGVYHHWDGYPAELGAVLFDLFHTKYRGDMKRMLQEIVDSHPGGWSDLKKGSCYCHTRKEEMARGFGDLQWASRVGCEWAYLFTVRDGKPMMVVARHLAEWDDRSGKLLREWWETIAIVSLDGEEPNWGAIERAGYERYDAVHGGAAA
jgi:FMN phosphatase YigB (HAD superfamily)